MSKARGRTPSLICGVRGKPTLEQISRQTSCNRCEAAIPKGRCFKIPKVGSGFSSKQSFCNACFGAILEQSKLDINELEVTLKEFAGAIEFVAVKELTQDGYSDVQPIAKPVS